MESQFGIYDELNWFGSYVTNREHVCCVIDCISSRKKNKKWCAPGINSWSVDIPFLY